MHLEKLTDRIKSLSLDLTGKVVLTEAATGAYIVTPILAAMAGAKVYAFSKNTRYGTAEEVFEGTKELMKRLNLHLNIHFITELTAEIIAEADIITNSGHLRPLNEEKLKHAKKGVVIPLMYEAWEWRNADLDLSFCKKKGITVGATNERHPDVDVFNYLGDMAMKLIFDAGLTPYNNYFTLIANNDFGPFIAKVLAKNCSGLAVCDLASNKHKYDGIEIDWIGDFPKFETTEVYANSEAIIFTAYPFDQIWIGNDNSPILMDDILKSFAHPFLLRYCGDIDEQKIHEKFYYPKHVESGHMGILPSAIGFDPILRLQSGGLKVGELLLKNEMNYKGNQIIELV